MKTEHNFIHELKIIHFRLFGETFISTLPLFKYSENQKYKKKKKLKLNEELR